MSQYRMKGGGRWLDGMPCDPIVCYDIAESVHRKTTSNNSPQYYCLTLSITHLTKTIMTDAEQYYEDVNTPHNTEEGRHYVSNTSPASVADLPTTLSVEPYSAVHRQKIPAVHRIWYSLPCTPTSLCSILVVEIGVSTPPPAYTTSTSSISVSIGLCNKQRYRCKSSFLPLNYSVKDLVKYLTDIRHSYWLYSVPKNGQLVPRSSSQHNDCLKWVDIMPEASQNNARSESKQCQKRVKTMPETSQNNARNESKQCQKRVKTMPEMLKIRHRQGCNMQISLWDKS